MDNKTFRLMSNPTARAGVLLLCGAATFVACATSEGGPSGPTNEGVVGSTSQALTYNTDFFDDFNGTSLDGNNWLNQDMVWVNSEPQCYDNGYNEGGQHRTLEVSNGALKLRVVDAGYNIGCNNWDKYGAKHGDSRYRAARIASKSKKEFAQGKWTARISFYTWKWAGGTGQPTGMANMFPAWWILGARNNEQPLPNPGYENVCWPLTGSGEIDILEHYGNNGQNQFTARGVKSNGACNSSDWSTYQVTEYTDMSQYHEFQVENTGADLIYRIDNNQVAANWGIGGNYPEPMFAILNYALMGGGMDGNIKEYAMSVDWVRHESAVASGGCTVGRTVGIKANANGLFASGRSDVSGVPVRAQASSVQGWEQFDIVDAGGGYVALRSHTNNLYVTADMNDANKTLRAAASSIQGWEKYQFVSVGGSNYGLKSAANGLYVSADLNNANAPLEAKWATSVGAWEQFQCQ